ncbi:uncharacterized protein B0I36DRAFT_90081 [Microdochium trichocladiopsis]|uniref:Uncharacterized protein n=1 Tax=Microdochium trichocladiopsis TaxID=1682393 RepID=A0A9P9BT44_9PEZI|nr:uncharacterized protein B0I36DRAFT_90081 [Microdochium trichocladiopsis]KAH7035249.1 hypothetical protein B0I36DRAFT_90081 [Microdochium trichocladiopsis]
MPPALPSPTDGNPPPVAYMSKYRLDSQERPPSYRPPADFPSPNQNHQADPTFHRHRDLVDSSIQEAKPEAVRTAVRRNWQKTLMGSAWHEAFILNILITTTSEDVVAKTVKQLAHLIAPGSARHLIPQFHAPDFDALADDILNRCSDQFLDKALERRLQTIGPKALINALARAERLGYEKGDILDESSERIIGGMPRPPLPLPPKQHQQPPPPPPPHPNSAVPPAPYVPQPQGMNTFRCTQCGDIFDDIGVYNHHVANRMCRARPVDNQGAKYVCPYCNAGFKTKGGLNYHELNKVCGPSKQASLPPAQPSTPVPVPPGPVFNHYTGPNLPTPTPAFAPPPTAVHAASTPPSSSDPYAHLTPQARARMNEEIRQAELTFAPRIKEAEAITNPAERKTRLANLNNSFSTRQSVIRKRYGVRLRIRRTRAEIEAQNARMGISNTTSETDDPPSHKRQRVDGVNTASASPLPSSGPPIPRVATADISAGLGGTAATPATMDPTRGFTSVNRAQPPPQTSNSLSSLQQKGYRVSSHLGQSSPERVASDLGATGNPISLSDSAGTSGSESESGDSGDDEIPAIMPTGRATGR